MRIGIDARILQTGLKNRGIGTYTYNLIRALLGVNTKHQFVFYLFQDCEIPEILKGREIIRFHQYKRLNIFFQQLNTLKGDIDIFHTLMAIGPSREIIIPYLQFKKTIGTVHDLTFYHLPDKWSRYLSHTKDYKLQIRALKKAKKIITISSYVKDDLHKTFGVPTEKVVVIHYGGASPIFKPVENKQSLDWIKEKYGITNKFILGVGDEYDYKKNISALLSVIAHLPELQLVIAGNSTNSKLSAKGGSASGGKTQNSKVIFTGEVPQEELHALYNLAEVLIFPSFAEGFGLPPLEAMACGCPVIASNRWSLPEVIGDGGITIEPYDVNGIVSAVKKLLEDSSFKKEFIGKGFAQTKKFSWEKCARETFRTYEKVLYE